VVRDHTAVNKQALALVDKLHVPRRKPPDQPGSVETSQDERSKLSQLKGAAFDRAYAQNEAAYHQTVNNALKTTLIPAGSNPELKSLLETGLKIFQSHERHAEHVVADLR
jgi:putative membrane protein